MAQMTRRAVTLIEVLIVVGILMLLIGLLLPAIQAVRLQSMRADNLNSAKQVLLASHQFASSHQNNWPSVDGNPNRTIGSAPTIAVIPALSPYLEADVNHPPNLIRFKTDPSRDIVTTNPVPHPPPPDGESVQAEAADQLTVTSLAFNPLVYAKGKQLSSSVPDGTSTTVALTEHYGLCNEARFDWRQIESSCLEFPSFQKIPCSSATLRRATFADGPMYQDVVPMTSAGSNGLVTTGSLPLTFQVRPKLDQCDPRIPQSSLPGGLLCGFADGSVRYISQGVSSVAFWSAVTPAGGEVSNLD